MFLSIITPRNFVDETFLIGKLSLVSATSGCGKVSDFRTGPRISNKNCDEDKFSESFYN